MFSAQVALFIYMHEFSTLVNRVETFLKKKKKNSLSRFFFRYFIVIVKRNVFFFKICTIWMEIIYCSGWKEEGWIWIGNALRKIVILRHRNVLVGKKTGVLDFIKEIWKFSYFFYRCKFLWNFFIYFFKLKQNMRLGVWFFFASYRNFFLLPSPSLPLSNTILIK